MKKTKLFHSVAALLAAVLLLAFAGSACVGTGKQSGKFCIVTTAFPVYDWIRNVVGEDPDIEIRYLLDTSVDLHSFQPTVQDTAEVAGADLFIYVGGESDERWVDKVLAEQTNANRRTMNLLEILGDRARMEEEVEGMESGEEEEEEAAYDEHIWLSVKNADFLTEAIAAELSEMLPAKKDAFQANAAAYREKLTEIDEAFDDAVRNASVKTLVFADRFPFLYLAKEYGLTYFAAFKGCSAEAEASFKTITFLAGKVEEYGLRTIATIETSDGAIARQVRDTTASKDQKILVFDSLQSASGAETDYLTAMQKNAETLKKALSN